MMMVIKVFVWSSFHKNFFMFFILCVCFVLFQNLKVLILFPPIGFPVCLASTTQAKEEFYVNSIKRETLDYFHNVSLLNNFFVLFKIQ